MKTLAAEVLTDLESRAYLFIVSRELSARGLAEALGVSMMTAARAIASLRKKGIKIVSVRDRDRWHYAVANREELARERWRRLRELAGFAKGGRPEKLKPEDEAIYGED